MAMCDADYSLVPKEKQPSCAAFEQANFPVMLFFRT